MSVTAPSLQMTSLLEIISSGIRLLSSPIDICEDAFIIWLPSLGVHGVKLRKCFCGTPQQCDDSNAFTLSKLRFFFSPNGQRQSCQTDCPIIWFKNQTKLLSPVIIFWQILKQSTRAPVQTVKKKLCFNSIASPRPGYHLVFLTYLLNFHSSSLGFWELSSSSIRKKISFVEWQCKHSSARMMSIH